MHWSRPEAVALAQPQYAEPGAADARSVAQHSLEHRLKVAGRTGNDLQHLRGRGLLLQRLTQVVGALTQLAEKAGVLDGNDGLRGEIGDYLNLLLREGADFLAEDDNCPHQFAFLHHRYGKYSAVSRQPRELHMGEAWRQIEVIRFVLNIGDLDRLSGRQRASERSGGGRPDHWVAPPLFNKRLGCAMQRNSPKPISFGPKQHAEFRLADTNGVLQHGLKHGGYLARRTRNHLENLRGRGLLLQRLKKLARPRLHLVEQSHVLDRDHRLVGEGRDQIDLLLREWVNDITGEQEYTYRCSIP